MIKKLSKLRGRSFTELRVRGQQALAALSEARGFSSQTRVPTDDALLALLTIGNESPASFREHFRDRSQPQFFEGLSEPEATLTVLRERWPASSEKIVERADRITEGVFDLLGFKELKFGDPIDWHLDPISKLRSPLVHWSRIDELNPSVGGDQKIVRELSRHQYFVTLGQAYWLTGDERYAQTFASHLASWMDQNPPKLGTHWGSSLELAFRSISWLWAFYFFKDSAALSAELFIRALKFLNLSARHIETFLSTYFSPNTHLTGEALGLYYLGTLLPEFREAHRWKETGRQILLEQVERHVRSDGVYFEQSSYYHRYTVDFYTHFLVLSRINKDELPAVISTKLEALLDHLMYITRPDGTTPLFGDDDGGRLLFFEDSDANDFGAALSNGAALFQRPDYKFVAREVCRETLWLFGANEVAKLDDLKSVEPAQGSLAFPESGFYVLRDSWSRDANYLLFDCGAHGILNCGHSHSDALSFELSANGRTLLVDPGTYTYTGSKELRDWFRSTAAHNTVTVDDEQSSVVAGPFSWQSIAQSGCSNWISHDRFDFVVGTHDGYQRLPDPVEHIRSILFLKNDYWIVQDRLPAHGNHRAKLHFHFESGVAPELSEGRLEESGFEIQVFGGGHWEREDGWVSHCYGSKEPAASFTYATPSPDIATFLLPQSAPANRRLKVREIEAIGGKGFEIAHPKGIDVLMLAENGSRQVETARLASDFLWTWARFAIVEDAAPSELVLLSGTSLQLEGKQILKTSRRLGFVLARRVGDQFTVETDDGILDFRFKVADFAAAFQGLSES